MKRLRVFLRSVLLLAALAGLAAPVQAQQLAGQALIASLRQGGYVLVMRHANSPAAVPDKASADPENTALERQLDSTGRETARAMGEAFRKLRIPVGGVLSSPTYRARLTVQLAQFGTPKTSTELDEGAAGMTALAEKARADFLRGKTAEVPLTGKNTLLVSHAPNIMAAFGKEADAVAAGETLVFRPAPNGGALVARVKIEDWPKFANGR